MTNLLTSQVGAICNTFIPNNGFDSLVSVKYATPQTTSSVISTTVYETIATSTPREQSNEAECFDDLTKWEAFFADKSWVGRVPS